jgi:CheY-like chemotaxis protein
VETAAGGEDGLRMAAELHPDLITLDVLMPGMDGWAVLAELKADSELANIPVIMLSMLDDHRMGYALGASDFVTKPIQADRLATVLDKYRTNGGATKVLIIEDDAATRQLVRRVLGRGGWQVDEAENGRIALQRVESTPPDLILLDLMMPEMDGFEFVSQLRNRDGWNRIPIVVMTAKDITEEDRERLSGSVVRILEKGAYSRDGLVSEIRNLVSSQTRQRPAATPST